ncbi:MAG: hypothetical protein ACXVCY_00685 [Pseudobdellovibrionaceae bacterium]
MNKSSLIIVFILSILGINSFSYGSEIPDAEYSARGPVVDKLTSLIKQSKTEELRKLINDIPFDRLNELITKTSERIQSNTALRTWSGDRLSWDIETQELREIQTAIKRYSSKATRTKLFFSQNLNKLADSMKRLRSKSTAVARPVLQTSSGAAALVLEGAYLQSKALNQVRKNSSSYECPFGDPTQYGETAYCKTPTVKANHGTR